VYVTNGKEMNFWVFMTTRVTYVQTPDRYVLLELPKFLVVFSDKR
jgi:hypothetical protein